MAKPDTLSFAVEPFEGTVSVTPMINGVSLSKLILDFEREQQFEPAGGYGGLIPTSFNYGSLSQYFLGEFENESYFAKLGPIYVLGCQCGEVGCWPLVCKVRRADGTMVWDSFQQPHRKERDYMRFGPFEFRELQYRDALACLERELSAQSRSDGI